MKKSARATLVLLCTLTACAVKTEKSIDTLSVDSSNAVKVPADTVRATQPSAPAQSSAPQAQQPGASENSRSTDMTVTEYGIGPLRAGMTISEAAAALGGGFGAPRGYTGGCGYAVLVKAPRGLAVMLENNEVARVEIRSGSIATTAGAKIGDSEARIKSLYAGRVSSTTQKYDPNGHYLTVTPTDKSAPYRIVFETDGKVVTNYRSGQLPAVEYVERCG